MERKETREDFYPRCEDALAAGECDAEESARIREWMARNPDPSE